MQFQLFDSFELDIECGSVIPSESVEVEKVLPSVIPGKFKIHSTGGWHYFKDVPGADSIFTKQIWPWIETYTERYERKRMMIPLITQNKGFYSFITLNNNTGFNNKKISMHKLVALAFLKKSDSSKKIVNHKNGWKVDYRIENLEWVSHSENSTGPLKETRLSPVTVYNMWKDTLKK